MLVHELMKVATLRSSRVAGALVLAFTGLLAYATARALSTAAEGAGTPVETLQVVLRTTSPSLVLAAVLGVCAVRAEIRDGVLRAALVRCPDRDHLLAVKAGSVLVVSVAAGLLSALLATAATVAVVGPVPASAWLLGVGGHTLLAAGWGLLGLCAGVLLPHLAGAVAGVLALPFVVEPAAAGLLGADRASLLPFRSGAGVYGWLGDSGALETGQLTGPLVLLPFAALLLGAGLLARSRFAVLEA